MKPFVLLTAVALTFGANPSAGVAAHVPSFGRPCAVATPADLAAARLAPPQTLSLGPYACSFIWSRSAGRAMNVAVRPLRMIGRDDQDIGPGLCAKALHSPEHNVARQKTRSCKELPGYGRFAALLTTDPDPGTGRFATVLVFVGSKDRVTVMAGGGVPGGDGAAVMRLSKVLAAKYS